MSIIIQNISEAPTTTGRNRYQLRINQRVICEFWHDRTHDGLAQCLRDAADAVENERAIRIERLLAAIEDL